MWSDQWQFRKSEMSLYIVLSCKDPCRRASLIDAQYPGTELENLYLDRLIGTKYVTMTLLVSHQVEELRSHNYYWALRFITCLFYQAFHRPSQVLRLISKSFYLHVRIWVLG